MKCSTTTTELTIPQRVLKYLQRTSGWRGRSQITRRQTAWSSVNDSILSAIPRVGTWWAMQSRLYLITTEINRETGLRKSKGGWSNHTHLLRHHAGGLRSNKLCTQIFLGQPHFFKFFLAISELHNKDDNQIPLRTFFMILANNPITLMVMYQRNKDMTPKYLHIIEYRAVSGVSSIIPHRIWRKVAL